VYLSAREEYINSGEGLLSLIMNFNREESLGIISGNIEFQTSVFDFFYRWSPFKACSCDLRIAVYFFDIGK
jgi:hypothetical protein